ncbi:hypothetical protein [Desulfospira joergensenii]|uniref:hypothetical protein n=1 Tax=Desulfospira joergensenii TaxID=53329 RepID=UPI0003B64C4D|nr:hypothetical protein [Desulfospira joergensenii]
MTYEELVDNFRSKKVFIYGKSVVQIVDMKTYADSHGTKTDFIFQTDRQNRGIITREHGNGVPENFARLDRKKLQLEEDILAALTPLVEKFRRETGSAPKGIKIHTSAVGSDNRKLVDYSVDACTVDLDVHRPGVDGEE